MKNKDLVSRAKIALNKQIKLIKTAPCESEISKNNQHLLGDADVSSSGFGVGAGELSCAGFFYYALDCSLLVAGTYSCAVSFNATGVSFDVGAFTSQIVGTFLVNPKDIAGGCHFTCIVADVAEGIATLSLYSTNGGLYGVFVGDTEGADLADMAGSGTLSVT